MPMAFQHPWPSGSPVLHCIEQGRILCSVGIPHYTGIFLTILLYATSLAAIEQPDCYCISYVVFLCMLLLYCVFLFSFLGKHLVQGFCATPKIDNPI